LTTIFQFERQAGETQVNDSRSVMNQKKRIIIDAFYETDKKKPNN